MGRPEVLERSRRDFLIAAAAALVAAGLVGTRPAPGPTTAAYPRTVRDAAGALVTIPAPPQRVVVTSEYTALDSLLALHRPPLAAVRRYEPDWPWSAAAGAAAVARLPDTRAPLDMVAGHRPDLLLHLRGEQPERLAELARIAPIVQYSGDDARACLRVVAAALDLADDAETVLAGFDDRISAARQRIRVGGRAGATFATFIVLADGTAGYYGMDKDATILLQDLGLRPNLMTARTDGWATLTPVLLPGLDADVLLGRYEEAGTEDVVARFEATPSFRAIPAVAAGRYRRLTWEQSWALGESSVLSWPVAADRIAEIVASLPA